MTDFMPNSDPTPHLWQQTVALVARHGLTVLAGILGEHGVLSADQQTQFISVGGALVLGAVSMAWSYVQKHNTKQAIKAVTV